MITPSAPLPDTLLDMADPTPDPLIPPLVSAAQAAGILGYTRAMVSLLANDGRLLGQRVGTTWVFRRAAVEAYRDEVGRQRAAKKPTE